MTAAELLTSVPVLVIDLEATCDDGDGLSASEMEIIEIGAVWATAEGTVLDTFQALVRPVLRPQLTPFCRQLTNIQQADVDGAELFPVVAARLASFAQRHQLPEVRLVRTIRIRANPLPGQHQVLQTRGGLRKRHNESIEQLSVFTPVSRPRPT